MHSITRLSPAEARAALPQLAEVLRDCVDKGASVSFLPPLSLAEATRFWSKVTQHIEEGSKILLVAKQSAEVVGTVVLDLSQTPNGLHRAEVQKLLVHSRARRQGLAQALMQEVEQVALVAGRTLLHLDTCQGSSAEQLYRKLGWLEVGIIPKFARLPEGYCDTVIFYKQLT